MKKKFLAILLGALMLVTMLPVGSIVASADVTNLMTNGDFEADFVTFNVGQKINEVTTSTAMKLPASGWTVAVDYRNPISGMVSQVEASDDFALPAGSTKAMKLERTALEDSSSIMHVHDEQFTASFEDGKTYNISFYYNIPEAITNGNAVISLPNAVGRTGTNYSNISVSTNAATDGWVKFSDYITYDAANPAVFRVAIDGTGSEGVLYVDEVKVTEYVTNNLLPNGGFEFGLASHAVNCADGAHTAYKPSDAWRFAASYRPTLLVAASRASSSEIALPVEDSAFCLKMEKAEGGYSNAYGGHVVYDIDSTVLDVNDVYKLEYYYNVKSIDSGTFFQGGFWGADFSTDTVAPYNSSAVSVSAVTDGWVKQSLTFKYTGAALKLRFGFRYDTADAGAALAYVDEVSLVKVGDFAPDSLLDKDGSFEASQDVKGAGNFVPHSSANSDNFQVVADPVNASNTVLYQLKNSSARGVINVPVKTNELTTDDLIKTTFRFYVKADETPEANFNLPIQYRIDGQTRSVAYIACSVTITPAQFNTWQTVEIYSTPLEISAASDRQLVILNNSSYDVYFDDFDVVPFVPTSSFAELGANGYRSKLTNYSTSVQDTFYSVAFGKLTSAPLTSYAADAEVRPFVVFAPAAPAEGEEAATKNALAILAIYNNQEGLRTLVDVKIVNVSALEGDFAVAPLTVYKLADLDAAKNEVECFLWDAALNPVANAAMPIAQ